MKRALLVFLLTPILWAAETSTCKNGNLERKVEIFYTDEAKKLPCEVRYFKEGETEPRSLWNAQNETGYCEQKASSLISTLEGAGFSCEGTIAKSSEPEAEKTPSPEGTATPQTN